MLMRDTATQDTNKKPLAFLLAASGNLAFAAGTTILSLQKQIATASEYEIILYYRDMSASDLAALGKIPRVTLIEKVFDEPFVRAIIDNAPPESRFRTLNHLMAFCHFDVFSLLDHYRTVVWIDVDTFVQSDISDVTSFGPFGITEDRGWTVQNNFSRPIDGYDMTQPGVCSAVMVVDDTLPYRDLLSFCYEQAIAHSGALINADQGIINIALQQFGITPNLMPLTEWQCIPWRDEASTARIVHFGAARKVWNDVHTFNAFPEWNRVYRRWLSLGGSRFDETQVRPLNVLTRLDEIEALSRDRQALAETAAELEAEQERLRWEVGDRRNRVEVLEREREEFLQTIAAMEREAEGLRNQNVERSGRVEVLERERGEFLQTIAVMEHEAEGLRNQNIEHSGRIEVMERERGELVETIAAIERQAAQQTGAIAALTRTVEEVTRSSKAEIALLRANATRLEREVEQAQTQRAEAAELLIDERNALRDQAETLAEQSKALTETRQELSAVRAEIDVIKRSWAWKLAGISGRLAPGR